MLEENRNCAVLREDRVFCDRVLLSGMHGQFSIVVISIKQLCLVLGEDDEGQVIEWRPRIRMCLIGSFTLAMCPT